MNNNNNNNNNNIMYVCIYLHTYSLTTPNPKSTK